MNTEVNEGFLLQCIKDCRTLGALEFLGQVLRVQSLNKLPHTLDEEFMDSCRSAYEERLSHFRRDDEGLRQQHAGSSVQERQGDRREQAASVPGELRDRRQGILDLQLDQDGEVGDEVYELEL